MRVNTFDRISFVPMPWFRIKLWLDFDENSVAFRKQSFTLLIFATSLSFVNTLLSSLCVNSDVASLLG